MTPVDIELAHMVQHLQPPYREGNWPYFEHKARRMAKHWPFLYEDLPRMLRDAMTAQEPSQGSGSATGSTVSDVKKGREDADANEQAKSATRDNTPAMDAAVPQMRRRA